jgi:MFS superfamily sulfate permease-like transporter
VLTGFKTGAALYIASTQLPKLFGVADGSGNFFERIGRLAVALPHAHWPTMLLGFAVLAALVLLANRFPGRPTTIGVVAVVLLVTRLDPIARLGIHMAGHIPNGLPSFAVPAALFSAAGLTAIAPVALACFVLAYVETIATGRSLAETHGETIDPERELLALGAANLATGVFHGFPVDGGMSQSAVNDIGGARSPFALVVTSASVALVLGFLAFIFSAVPDPLLAAIVVMASIHLIRVGDLIRIWNGSRHEFWVAIFAAFAVLVTGLLSGVMWAVVVSLLMVLARTSRPEIAMLGHVPGTTLYVNVAYNANAVIPTGVLAVRTFGPWYYFNASYIHRRLLHLVDTATATPQLVVIDFSASPTLDTQACGELKAIDDDLRTRGIRLELARLYDETTNMLLRTHALRSPVDRHETVDTIVERFTADADRRSPRGSARRAP